MWVIWNKEDSQFMNSYSTKMAVHSGDCSPLDVEARAFLMLTNFSAVYTTRTVFLCILFNIVVSLVDAIDGSSWGNYSISIRSRGEVVPEGVWGVEVYIHSFLTSTWHRSQWSTLRTSRFTSGEIATDACRGIVRVGPSAGLDFFEKIKICYPCRESSHDSSDRPSRNIVNIPTN